jgi:uncharacterized protein (TIGR02588 family)
MTQTNQDSNSSEKEEKQPHRSPAEWTSFGIATSILAAIVGLVLFNWFDQKINHQFYQPPPMLKLGKPKGNFTSHLKLPTLAEKQQNQCKLSPNCASMGKWRKLGNRISTFSPAVKNKKAHLSLAATPKKAN